MPVSYESFLREVMPDVSGCPIQIAENAIRNSAIEFCNETRVWRERIVDVPVLADTSTYTLDTTGSDGASNVVTVHRAKFSDSSRPLSTIPTQHLDDQWQPTGNTQRPWYFNCQSPPVITLYPTPSEALTLEVWAILKPTLDGTEGPQFLFDDWLEAIAAGAKSKLMYMSGRVWSNPKMAPYHRQIFVRGTTEARIRDAKSNVQSSSFMTPRVKFGRYTNSRWFR